VDEEGVDHTSGRREDPGQDLATAADARDPLLGALIRRGLRVGVFSSTWTVTISTERQPRQDHERYEIHSRPEDVDNAEIILSCLSSSSSWRTRNRSRSVIISPVPAPNQTNRKKIEGIVRLVMFAVEGLSKENIDPDHNGNRLNNFDDMVDLERWRFRGR
jgi:hypothetical protein